MRRLCTKEPCHNLSVRRLCARKPCRNLSVRRLCGAKYRRGKITVSGKHSRWLCPAAPPETKTGAHAGRPFSFTFYITAESESSCSAVFIVHLVYSMCQIFSLVFPVLFSVPATGMRRLRIRDANCFLPNKQNPSSPSVHASFRRSRGAN